ncbi:hypothetical protein [Thermoactinomyces mirandus]|uniref:hypothetical protein n=1 Tax=Thermoactinomyces mirandus TaxID=2756294 RepID=UPI001C68CCF3|nr:hypothetical protein [Thermoactinomyces mirandus]
MQMVMKGDKQETGTDLTVEFLRYANAWKVDVADARIIGVIGSGSCGCFAAGWRF